MATSFHPSDIQYVADPSIQLQSLTYFRNSDVQLSSYHDSDPRDLYPNNGHYGNGSGSSPPAGFSSHHQPSSPANGDAVEIDVEEETSSAAPARTDPPKDFYRVSVFLMILFCSPIALTAVQSSIQCRRAISMRNMDIAWARSQEAKGRACLSIVTGITSWICVGCFIVLGVLSSS